MTDRTYPVAKLPSSDRAAWGAYGVLVFALSLLALIAEHLWFSDKRSMFLFFCALALVTAMLPASGPRGRRVVLLPGVGLASFLLLPAATAILPLLLANALYAATRDTVSMRRWILERGGWLALAMLSGSAAYTLLCHGSRQFSPLCIAAATAIYGAVYLAGRQISLRRPDAPSRTMQRWIFAGWQLETLGLLASAPVAALMALAAPDLGLVGVIAAAGLMVLLLLLAHFGFQVALLQEQVWAMEKMSALALTQVSPLRLAERFLHLSSSLLSCDRASLWLVDDSQTRLVRAAHWGASPVSAQDGGEPGGLRFGEGLIGRVADRQVPVIVRDGTRDPRHTTAEGHGQSGPFSLLLAPLIAGGDTVGVAQFERDAAGSYTRRDTARIRALTAQAAATMATVRMHRDIYNQAVTDSLTGLFNRRHVQTALLDEIRRARRYGHDLSVVMLDVDGFKSYNDTYGHPQGDVLLQMVAQLLRGNVRGVDIIGRYGGEEFIILMPETSAAESWQTAERLRLAVAGALFPGHPGEAEPPVSKTISLGVATCPEDTQDPQMLISLADKALYVAKNSGRNRTVSSGDVADAPRSSEISAGAGVRP